MASFINCPHIGPRPREEFTIKGAVLERPAPDSSFDAWMDYVYWRENKRGLVAEFWHHTFGTRRWFVVLRDTQTHEVEAVHDAADYMRGLKTQAAKIIGEGTGA